MYKIQKFLKKGYAHKDFCEDSLFVRNYGRYIVASVFDGCSAGIDSYFASALYSRSFAAVTNSMLNENLDSEDPNLFPDILYYSTKRFFRLSTELNLRLEEMLSTVIFMLFDTITSKAKVIALGDGYIHADGTKIDIDQNNRPHYVAYSKEFFIDRTAYEVWFGTQPNMYIFENVKDITISTDGISSFTKALRIDDDFAENDSDGLNSVQDKQAANAAYAIDYLSFDTQLIGNSSMFGRKCNILKSRYGLVNYDDLGMVRVVLT